MTLLLLTATPPVAAEGQVRENARTGRGGPGIVGIVVDRVTGRPLEGAAVTLEPMREGADTLAPLAEGADTLAPFAAGADTLTPLAQGADTLEAPTEGPDTLRAPAPVVTDSAGRFVFEGIADGRYRIEIDRIGYRTMTDSIGYQAALGLRIDVQMVEEAVELEPLLVVAEMRSLRLESAGFYDRRRRGIGRFLTREEILAGSTLRVSDVLRTMPGVRMSGRGSAPGEEVVRLRGGCLADVYVDGVRLSPPAPVDALLAPTDLDALEVYHASELPAGFRTTTCGAVMAWTHVPNPGSVGDPFTWRKVLAAASFLGLALLLTR